MDHLEYDVVSPRSRIVAGVLALGASLTAGGFALASSDDPKGSLSCVAPLDAAGIDRVLTEAGSPLAGQGSTFVTAAASVGIDPRLVVAISGHETVFMTYGPAKVINNPFGIGPGHVYATSAEAIQAAATLLAEGYVGQGRTTLAAISAKYAPVGASNDPSNLNANWVSGVGTLYARLGGNPDAPVTLNAQPTSCDGSTPVVPTDTASDSSRTTDAGDATTSQEAPDGPSVITWDGTEPRVASEDTADGADPLTGRAATVDDFVFPLAAGGPTPTVRNDFRAASPVLCTTRRIRCSTTVVTKRGHTVVAVASGRLALATADEQRAGIGFWITTRSGDRFGYSSLVTYDAGIMDGASVDAGRPLGTSTRILRFAWERSGERINAAPLLAATLG